MKQTIYLVIMTVLIWSCKNEKKPLAGNSVNSPKISELNVEDPFSGTNLVDNTKIVDLENNPVDLKSLAGKNIFLNFWATWCKPCILEMPSIERAEKLLSNDNFVFLIASDESIGRINRFKATKDFDLQFVRLETPFPDIGILSLPTTLIIDPNGKIVMNQIGALEWDNPEVLEKLRGVTSNQDQTQ
jgi:thiol-disulfide isomerase/thioredoxin